MGRIIGPSCNALAVDGRTTAQCGASKRPLGTWRSGTNIVAATPPLGRSPKPKPYLEGAPPLFGVPISACASIFNNRRSCPTPPIRTPAPPACCFGRACRVATFFGPPLYSPPDRSPVKCRVWVGSSVPDAVHDGEMGEDVAQAAALMRRLIEAIEQGELEADSPAALALLRRMEGAATALEQAASRPGQVSPRPNRRQAH